MSLKKKIGRGIKYLPLFFVIMLHTVSLYRGVTEPQEDMQRSIQIWTYTLLLLADAGGIGGMWVLDRFHLLMTGKPSDVVDDFLHKSSEDVSVMFNGLIASTVFLNAIFILFLLSAVTKIPFFSSIATVISIAWMLGSIVYMAAEYLKIKQIHNRSLFAALSDPTLLPILLSVVLVFITGQTHVGWIYRQITNPQNDVILILIWTLLLCYVLALAYCHFSNLYCLIGFYFCKRDPDKIEKTRKRLQDREQEREAVLRRLAKDTDEGAKQVGFFKRMRLGLRYLGMHMSIYLQNRGDAVLYLLTAFRLYITRRFGTLLHLNVLKRNGIRFCLVTAVLELLSLDLILFMFWEADSVCLKFFELLSTVIIIPILLSWLSALKSGKKDAEKEKKDSRQ